MNQLGCGKVVLFSCVLMSAWGCTESKIPPRYDFGGTTTPSVPQTPTSGGGSGGAGGAKAPVKADAGATKPGPGTPTKPAGDADGGLDEDAGEAPSVTPLPKPTKGQAARAGHWAGTTSEGGRPIEFDLSATGLTQLRLSWGILGCDGDNTTDFKPARPLDDEFSIEFNLAGETSVILEGTFDDDSHVSGTVQFDTTNATFFSCGVGRATWSATRE